MYADGKATQNFLIEPGDVIYVPLSPLAETEITFKKVLFPIHPRDEHRDDVAGVMKTCRRFRCAERYRRRRRKCSAQRNLRRSESIEVRMNTQHALAVFTLSLRLPGPRLARRSSQSTANAEGPQGVFKAASGHDTSLNEYVVDPPDEIQIKAPNIKEVDGSKQVVRADGKISLNLLGEIKVSGLDPRADPENRSSKSATKFYTNPDIKVEVIANSKYYTIFGRGSTTGGKKPYTGNDTVIKALAEAGMNEQAWPQQIWVVRPARNGEPRGPRRRRFPQDVSRPATSPRTTSSTKATSSPSPTARCRRSTSRPRRSLVRCPARRRWAGR